MNVAAVCCKCPIDPGAYSIYPVTSILPVVNTN